MVLPQFPFRQMFYNRSGSSKMKVNVYSRKASFPGFYMAEKYIACNLVFQYSRTSKPYL